MADPIISIRKASVVYGDDQSTIVRAVDDVTLDIYPQEYVVFFGPSGCGKSTLLYSIAGLERLTGGSISVLGKDLVKLSRKEMVKYHRRSVGMVFQAYYLISSLKVLQNIVLPRIFLSSARQEREKRGKQLLDRFGILPQANKYPNQLSGGQQQRVAISRSLANDPPILLADEPVGNLDSKSAASVLELLSELNKKDKKTIVLVTHNPDHLHYAHRVFHMKDGKIVREVKNQPEKQATHEEKHMRPMMNYGLGEFARIYPNLNEEDLKAKMMASYLLNELEVDTEQRIEDLVGRYLQGRVDADTFVRLASRPLRGGGIGLYKSHAERLVESLKRVVGLGNFLLEEFKTFPRDYERYQRLLDRITTYLLNVSETKPSPEQIERLDAALKSRLEGSLNHIGFRDALDKPFAEGGVGLNIRTARNMSRQLELLLINFHERLRQEEKRTLEEGISVPHLFGLKEPPQKNGEKTKKTAVEITRKNARPALPAQLITPKIPKKIAPHVVQAPIPNIPKKIAPPVVQTPAVKTAKKIAPSSEELLAEKKSLVEVMPPEFRKHPWWKQLFTARRQKRKISLKAKTDIPRKLEARQAPKTFTAKTAPKYVPLPPKTSAPTPASKPAKPSFEPKKQYPRIAVPFSQSPQRHATDKTLSTRFAAKTSSKPPQHGLEKTVTNRSELKPRKRPLWKRIFTPREQKQDSIPTTADLTAKTGGETSKHMPPMPVISHAQVPSQMRAPEKKTPPAQKMPSPAILQKLPRAELNQPRRYSGIPDRHKISSVPLSGAVQDKSLKTDKNIPSAATMASREDNQEKLSGINRGSSENTHAPLIIFHNKLHKVQREKNNGE